MKNALIFLIFCENVVSIFSFDLQVKDFPASDFQLSDLAEDICDELVFESSDAVRNKCQSNFMSKRRRSKETQALEIKCQSKDSVTVAVTPLKVRQLVALLDHKNKTKRINYVIIDPNQRIGTIFTTRGNFSIWMTTLDDDNTPALWKKGPDLQPWAIKEKSYDIKIQFSDYAYERDKYFTKAFISWNATDPTDSCFYILNSCNKNIQGNLFEKKIEPYQDRNVTIVSLPLDDSCTVSVSGKYGTTKHIYETPSCDTNLPGCVPLPEVVINMTLHHSQDENDELWTVLVRWSQPRHAPANYNVTLRTVKTVQSVIIPGNLTEVQFKGVPGEGLYNVSVESITASGSRKATSRRKYFPVREEKSTLVDLLVGAAWSSALLVASFFLLAVIYWRRMRTHSHIDYGNALEKITQEEDTGSGCSVGGVEDGWEVRPELLLLHEVIGEGAFGVVRRGTFTPSNKDVAVKMLKGFPSVDEIRSFRAEMELMKSVGAHPHVVSMLGCCSGRRPLIVAEYCSRGDLLSYLRCSWDMMISRRNAKNYNNRDGINYRNYIFKSKENDLRFVSNRLYDFEGAYDTELTYRDLLSFCRQIAMGMEFLASNRVVHRDLAARNVLVTADRTLKIADFGLSRDVYQENQYKQEGNGKMPVKWMALESLTHRIYTTHSDVWSFGVVVWEVVTVGGAPYAGVGAARLPRLLAAGYRMPRPPNCTPALYDLMVSCWSEAPRSRPPFSALHEKLDEMLTACSDHYLSLALPTDVPETHSRPHRYMRMLIRGRRKRTKSYERPFAASKNHYTDQPAVTTKAGLVLCS